MKVFTAEQKRKIDLYTIENEPISSIDLMERAASNMLKEFLKIINKKNYSNIIVFCGQGNNGGDGLALTRLYIEKTQKNNIQAVYCNFSDYISVDCKTNLEILKNKYPNNLHIISDPNEIYNPDNSIIIDSLFGTGLNRPIQGKYADLIDKINGLNYCLVVSIDIPSGIYSEMVADNNTIAIKANDTLCIDSPVLSALLNENNDFFGNIHIVDIGLSAQAKQTTKSNYEIIDYDYLKSKIIKRKRFDHKGVYGHCFLISGSYGKAGAAILAAKAALKVGTGLVTLHIPGKLLNILQVAIPEAMCIADINNFFVCEVELSDKYSAIGIGPGLSVNENTINVIKNVCKNSVSPIVIDADGINCLAKIKNFQKLLKPGFIITPHPKEFSRLFGNFNNSLDIISFMRDFSIKTGIIIVYKIGISIISTPDGIIYFNIAGNPGMATAGSGDVLTGIIAGLLAQKYNSIDAAIIGVFIHALSGDIAASKKSMTSLIASDIIDGISEVFSNLEDEIYCR